MELSEQADLCMQECLLLEVLPLLFKVQSVLLKSIQMIKFPKDNSMRTKCPKDKVS